MGEKTTILTMPPKRSRSLHGQIRHLQDNTRIFSTSESNFVEKARNIQYREKQAKDAGLTEHEMSQRQGADFIKDKDRLNFMSWEYPEGVTQLRGKGGRGSNEFSWEEKKEYLQNKEARMKRNHENRIKSIQNRTKLVREDHKKFMNKYSEKKE
mgnify:FL=1